MATTTLNTRLMQKFDTWENWQAHSSVVLLQGEIAVVQVPAASTAINGDADRPQYLIKIGDGATAFANLPFVSSTAADVYDWAKAPTKPSYTLVDFGVMASPTELNFTDGVTSNIQTQLNGKAPTHEHPFLSNTTKYASSSTQGGSATSAVTLDNLTATVTELNYVDGVTSNIQAQLNGKSATHSHPYIPTSEKGAASGVASLDTNGKVPAAQLPSYVDDVLEYAAKTNFPSTGETGKIYVAIDTNRTYRWSGTAYVEISASLAIGTTSSTAAAGNHNHDAAYLGISSQATDSARLEGHAASYFATAHSHPYLSSSTNYAGSSTQGGAANKVANKLTAGSKTFDGSAAVTITAADLGAITAHQTLPTISVTDTGTDPVVSDITASGHTIMVTRKKINVITDLSEASGDYLIFNCGSSSTVI